MEWHALAGAKEIPCTTWRVANVAYSRLIGHLRVVLQLAMLIMVTSPVLPATAQELSLLAGHTRVTEVEEESYAWTLQYLQALNEHFAVSFSWLNEGHLDNHHRDGQTVQIWARAPVLDPRLSLSAGFGPYTWFDTARASEGASYGNDHGWGAVFSLGATWYSANRWFYQLRAQRIITDQNFDGTSFLAGVGYQLEPPASPGPVTKPVEIVDRVTANEITVYLGNSIANSFNSELGLAKAIEYRRGIARQVDWTVAWLHEGDAQLVRRNGVMTQVWLVRDFMEKRVALGVGGGLYYAVDKYRELQPGEESDDTLSGVVTATASYRFKGHWLTRVSWNRIVTNYSRDSDVILIGIGYRF
jgi:hypothetical protein